MAAVSSEDRARIARDGLQAYNAGDIDSILRVLTEDVEIFASPELANAGDFRGHEGFMRWITPWAEVWEEINAEILDMASVGERHVIAFVHQTGEGRDGIEVSMDVGFVFEIDDDGLVTYLALLPNREEALAIARAREAAG